jgi:hypothetical protein
MRIGIVAALSANLLYVFPALAAQPVHVVLQGVDGKVFVNQGKGFKPAQEATALKSGDKIMLGDGATASLVFPDISCSVPLEAVAVTTVTGNDMCKVSQTSASSKGLVITPTATETFSDSSAVAVGLGFSAMVAGAGLFGALDNNKSSSGP